MYNKSNYEDAFYDWYRNFGGCEVSAEDRGWDFYNLLINTDDESACSWAGIDYDSEDWKDDLDTAKAIAYKEIDDLELSLSLDWSYRG